MATQKRKPWRYKPVRKIVPKLLIVGDPGVGKTCMIRSSVTGKYPTGHVPTRFDEEDDGCDTVVNRVPISIRFLDSSGFDLLCFHTLTTLLLLLNHARIDYPSTQFLYIFGLDYTQYFSAVKNKKLTDTYEMHKVNALADDGRYRLGMLDYVIKRANVAVICYSVASPTSLDNILSWARSVRYQSGIPIMLVGTMVDLRETDVASDLANPDASLLSLEKAQAMCKSLVAAGIKDVHGQVLECSAKTGQGIKEVVETAVRLAMLRRRYTRVMIQEANMAGGKREFGCFYCNKPSKYTCLCKGEVEQFLRAPETIRQWCRMFSMPGRYLERAEGAAATLINFFVVHPGLQQQVGGRIAAYYNPFKSESYILPSCCVVM